MSPLADVNDDAAVIRLILEGQTNAFEQLLDRYQDHVLQIVGKHVPRDHVPEVGQDVFIRTYQSLSRFKGTGPFKNWLSKIAVRCCYDFWRDYYQRRETPVSSISEECRRWLETLLADQAQEEEKERREDKELVHWALGQLSPGDRTVLTLTYLEEYSVAETAGLLGWSVPRVKIQSYRARRKLRKILGKILPP
jgi:RNA polymerase sigma-70 factor (ECF subfamily)